jgi:hypothetical protein
VDRVERSEWVLEDHLDLAAVGNRCLAGFLAKHVDAVDDDLAGGGFLEPDDSARDGALAAAGLTDERHDFALVDVEVDIVEGTHDLAGEQPADLKSLVSPRRLIDGVALGVSIATS